jgi:hypothetical protein
MTQAGSVQVVTNQPSSGATVSPAADSSPLQDQYIINPVQNVLENFASYSPLWTLACLSPKEFNNPDTYRKNNVFKTVVFSSAGRADAQRVGTAYGTPEYYINNFIMKSVIAPTPKTGNTNSIKFDFDVYEPYSMGLLLQSLQVAARNSDYSGYLEAVYCLKLEFLGFGESGNRIEYIKPKFFTIKITKATFQVTESGSMYKVEAVPYNHQGFSDQITTLYNDIKIYADSDKGTVEELLTSGTRSLCAALNKVEEDLVKNKRIKIKDVYDIQFPVKASGFASVSGSSPSDNRATVPASGIKVTTRSVGGSSLQTPSDKEINDVGKSDFGYSQSNGGNFIFKNPEDVIDADTGVVKRDLMIIDPKNRLFQFSQGQSILSMINQIILSSQYAKDNLTPDRDGFISWWKIDVQIELLDFDDTTGEFAKKFTYRVVPFKVHHTIFSNPNAAPIGYAELSKKIVKRYDYIYTGQNVDILKFDILIDNLFFSGANSSPENKSAQVTDRNDDGISEQTNSLAKTGTGPAPAGQAANLGRARVRRDPALLEKSVGGSNTKDTEQMVAESFHKAFTDNIANLVKVNLEVLGDPYWMADSGIGNYFAPEDAQNSQLTVDGTMNYEAGDVFVYLSFRTPSDIDEATGLYLFPTIGKDSPFSGIYRVVMCENVFADGIFKQKLECLRMQGQINEFKGLPPAAKEQPKEPDTSPATTIEEKEKIPSSPIDDTGYSAFA